MELHAPHLSLRILLCARIGAAPGRLGAPRAAAVSLARAAVFGFNQVLRSRLIQV
jgi:hypothetical protein